MRPKVYWVGPPAGRRLAMMPRPRADDWLGDEIAGGEGKESTSSRASFKATRSKSSAFP